MQLISFAQDNHLPRSISLTNVLMWPSTILCNRQNEIYCQLVQPDTKSSPGLTSSGKAEQLRLQRALNDFGNMPVQVAAPSSAALLRELTAGGKPALEQLRAEVRAKLNFQMIRIEN